MYELDNNVLVNKLKFINFSTVSVFSFKLSLLSISIAVVLFFYNLFRHFKIANRQELLQIFNYTPEILIWIFILFVCLSIVFGAVGWWARYMSKFPDKRPKYLTF